MTVIYLENHRRRRGGSQAEGQMAALEHLQQEIAAAGYGTAAQLVELAILSIAEQSKAERGA